MSRARLIIEFRGLIGGTDSLYLSNGPVNGISSNLYRLLKRKTIQLPPAELGGPTKKFKTIFPELTFSIVDKDLAITRILKNNKRYRFSSMVIFWMGDPAGTFDGDIVTQTDYNTLFFGWLEVPVRDNLQLTFTCGSVFRRLMMAIQPPTAQAELAAQLNDPTALICFLKNAVGVGVDGNSFLTNGGFESGADGTTPSGWTDDGSGKIKKSAAVGGNTGTRAAVNTDTGTTAREIFQEFNVGAGRVMEASAYVNSRLSTDTTSQYRLIAETRDVGGAVLGSYDTGLIARPPNIVRTIFPPLGPEDIETMIWVRDGRTFLTEAGCTHARLRLILKNEASSTQPGAFDDAILQTAIVGRVDREIISVTGIKTGGPLVGQANLGARGMFGSYPMSHKQDAEVTFFTPVRGHICDVIRRLACTTEAGGNGAYDLADGLGQGQYFPDALIDHSVFDAQAALAVSSGNPLTDYDHSLYQVQLDVEARIENPLEFIENEILYPFAANLVLTPRGKLGIVIHTAADVGDGSTLEKSSLAPKDAMFADEALREEVCTEVHYKTDFDPNSSTDNQGTMSSGNSKFLNERPFTEVDMGQDDGDTAAAEFGPMPIVIESKGIRSSASGQAGLMSSLHGDRIMFERARVILTRWRQPLQRYTDLSAALGKITTVASGSKPTVTTGAVVDDSTARYGRSADVMFCEGVGFDFDRAVLLPVLVASGDIVQIPNTNIADAMIAPLANDWRLFQPPTLTGKPTGVQSDDFVGIQWRRIRRYCRNFANLAWLQLLYDTVGQGSIVSPLAPCPARVASIVVDSGTPSGAVTIAAPPSGGTQATAHVSGAAIVMDNHGLAYDLLHPPAVTVTGATAHAVMATSDYQATIVEAFATLEATLNAAGTGHPRGENYNAGTNYGANDVVKYPTTGQSQFWRRLNFTLGTNGHTPAENSFWTIYPGAGDWNSVDELFNPTAETHVLFWSAASSVPATFTQRLYVRLAYRNKDWKVGAYSDYKQVGSNTAFDLGDRNPRKKIFQISTDSGRPRTTWVM